METDWFQQLKVMIWKNLLIKKRKKGYTIYELLFPVYFVAILAVVRLTQPKDMEQFGNFPEYQLADPRFRGLIQSTHKLLVIPDNSETRNVMAQAVAILSSGTNDTYNVEYYNNRTDLEVLYKQNSSTIIAGVIFNYNSEGNLTYALRLPGESVPSAKSGDLFAKQSSCRSGSGSDQNNDNALTIYNCDVNKYLFAGFTQLQAAIDTALIRVKTGLSSFPAPNITVQMMSKPGFMRDNTYMQVISSMYFVLAYSPFINLLTVELVTEKEKKIKEGMKMMGLQSSVFWFSWVAIYVVMIGLVTAVVTVIAYAAKLFIASNMFLFFILLFLYGLSIICMSFMVTPFFNKARTAGGLASFATILMSVLYLAVSLTRTYQEGTDSVSYKIPVYGRWLMALLSPVALALGIDQAIYLDITKGGATFETAKLGEFPLYGPIIMLVVDTLLYFLLAVYFDNVIPGEYGPRYKPWFIFTKSFWCRNSNKYGDKRASFTPHEVLIQNNDAFLHDSYTNPSHKDARRADVEPVTADVEEKLAVRITKLTKTFKSKDKDKEDVKAVNELTLNMYEDQITAILGHNGAGKTTLMNILTGMTPATSGVATVKGLDVSDPDDVNALRKMTGVCPQHNILFDLLTCLEHLQLFAGIKGVPAAQIDKEVEAALDSVGLKDQKDVQSTKLSGGQKRKLSVAIAIIGDPKIIFLDEPTAGMDPYSRRHLWAILKEKKKGRIILLTTHFMDEADILADRKAIVNKGALRCCGSSLFLKNRFGLGYHLNLVVTPNSDTNKIVEHVSGVIEGSELNRVHGKEVDVTLPYTGVTKFPDLFTDLEQPSTVNSLGIKNYGISMTTLEEVFLRLEEDIESIELEEAGDKGHDQQSLIPRNRVADSSAVDLGHIANPSDTVECITGGALAMQRFWALVYLRVLNHLRSPTATVIQLFMPVVLVIIGLVVANNSQSDFNEKVLDKKSPLKIYPGYYSNMKNVPGLTFPYTTVPRLLIRDTENNTDSQSVVTNLNSIYFADSNYSNVYFNDTFKLLLPGIYPHYMGIQIDELTQTTYNSTYKVMYNDSAVHSIPATISIMSNALLKIAEAAAGISGSNSSITTYTIPWLKFENPKEFNTGLYISSMLIGMAFSFIPSGFAYFVVKDRETKVRTQIRVSGMPFSLYWGSFFFVDFIKFFIPGLLTLIAIFAIGVESFGNAGAAVSLLITCFLYIPSNILLAYVFSFVFSKSETAMGALPTLVFMLGYLPYLPVSMVDMLGNQDIAKNLHYAFCFLDPAYTIFGAIYYINRVYQIAVYTNSQDDIPFDKYFEMESAIPICYIASIVNIFVYMILLRMLDVVKTGGSVADAFRLKPLGQASRPNTDIIKNEDSDIAAERDRVRQFQQNPSASQPVVLAEDLRKEFKKTVKSGGCKKEKKENVKVAVRNQTFAVDAGEVFGLLGPNGAGKTTTLNLMIADVGPDSGKVQVAGYDIRSSMSDAFQAMGYCPQHDSLLEPITLEEHLTCYAKTRGIPPEKIKEVVDFFIDNLKLGEHRKKHSSKLSGGTKRKLCYCISMMGRPKIVLLDEPSTGMDPQSKRFLWDTISQSFENSERGAILTTHYMEEADALCNRIAIMVNGKMECIGSSQHLKNKYGKGYLLEVKLAVDEFAPNVDQMMGRLQSYITDLFPKAVVMEQFSERVQYKVPKSDVTSLSHAFTVLEQGKQKCKIAEYSFSQSTLEQVFLEFAKAQVEGDQTEEEQEVEHKQSIIRAMSVENGDVTIKDDREAGFEPVRL